MKIKSEVEFLKELKEKIIYVENELPYYMIDERIKLLEEANTKQS